MASPSNGAARQIPCLVTQFHLTLGDGSLRAILSGSGHEINATSSRMIAVAAIDKASRSTATNALTTKKNDLAKTELDAGYQARFIEELKLLGGHRIPIAPQSKSGDVFPPYHSSS